MLVRLLYDNDVSACELTEHKKDASMKEESSSTSGVAIFLIAGVLQPLSSSGYRNIRLGVRASCGWCCLLVVGGWWLVIWLAWWWSLAFVLWLLACFVKCGMWRCCARVRRKIIEKGDHATTFNCEKSTALCERSDVSSCILYSCILFLLYLNPHTQRGHA